MVIVLVALPLLHPAAFVPVTVYVVVTKGVTAIADKVEPVLHKYVLAPLADKISVVPEHIEVEGSASILTVGEAFTITFTVAGVVLLQPAAVVPTTV